MAEGETTNAAQAEEPTGATATETQTDLVSDLSKVDPKALQSAVDKAVQQALRTRESNLRTEAKKAEEAAERKRLEEAGEFTKLRERLQAEVETLKGESRAKDVRNALHAEALQAGLRDLTDLALVPHDTIDALADKDGKIDSAAVRAAVADLRKSKPYLFADAKDDAATPRRQGGPTPGDALPTGGPEFDLSLEGTIRARQKALAAAKAAPQPRAEGIFSEMLRRSGR